MSLLFPFPPRTQQGHPKYTNSSLIPGAPVTEVAVTPDAASKTELKGVLSTDLYEGDLLRLATNGNAWRWSALSVAADATENLVLVPADLAASAAYISNPLLAPGRWLLQPGVVDIALPFTYATANNAVLWTAPVGSLLLLDHAYWEVTTGFTGGSSSSLGVNTSNASGSSAGDVLGGSGGDIAATLVTGAVIHGTIGGKTAAGIFVVAADTIKFNRIVDAYAAGVGIAHVLAKLLKNPGV